MAVVGEYPTLGLRKIYTINVCYVYLMCRICLWHIADKCFVDDVGMFGKIFLYFHFTKMHYDIVYVQIQRKLLSTASFIFFFSRHNNSKSQYMRLAYSMDNFSLLTLKVVLKSNLLIIFILEGDEQVLYIYMLCRSVIDKQIIWWIAVSTFAKLVTLLDTNLNIISVRWLQPWFLLPSTCTLML